MRKIKLTKGYEAIVDTEDFEAVNEFAWRACVRELCDRRAGYSETIAYAKTNLFIPVVGKRRRQQKTLYLHRFIMQRVTGRKLYFTEIVDHVNGNRLDCRRNNLRVTTSQENNQNRKAIGETGFRGVSMHSIESHQRQKKFRARIVHPTTRKRILIGYFQSAEEAAWAYDEKARELGFPPERLNGLAKIQLLPTDNPIAGYNPNSDTTK